MASQKQTTERLKVLFNGPEEAVGLAEAALLFASDEYPELDVRAYLGRLDALAANVRARLPAKAPPETIIAAMNQVLFEEEGFKGNAVEYYDPRNSFLNDVLDRKLGIPITLSIVYVEVGRRLGLSLEGVSFPGHFLVSLPLKERRLVLDPYSGGMALSAEELSNRLLQAYGRQPAVSLDRLLAAAGKREILVRMLRNLKAIYLRQENSTRALSVVDRILLVWPDLPEEVRDRGLLYDRLECAQAALQDYRRYLDLAPDAPDAGEIRNRMIDIGKATPHLH